MDQVLHDLFYDQHLTSLQPLHEAATQQIQGGISKNAVRKWMSQQSVQQQQKRTVHADLPIYAKAKGQFQIDITFMEQFAKIRNDGSDGNSVPVEDAAANELLLAVPDTNKQLRPLTGGAVLTRSQRAKNGDKQQALVNNPRLPQRQAVAAPANPRRFYLNEGYTAIFTCVEVSSRMCYLYPLKTKQASECARVAEQWLKDVRKNGSDILQIQSDDGGEFKAEFAQWVTQHNIRHDAYPGDSTMIAIINSFHMHYKQWTLTQMITRQSLKWIDLVAVYETYYNEQKKHSALRLKTPEGTWRYYTPKEFNDNRLLQQKLYKNEVRDTAKLLQKEHQYKVGEKVRVQYIDRGYLKATTLATYTKQVFTISAVKAHRVRLAEDQRPNMWIHRKYLQLVSTPAQDKNRNQAADDALFVNMIHNNRKQRKVERALAELAN
jgi:hypothetical protein